MDEDEEPRVVAAPSGQGDVVHAGAALTVSEVEALEVAEELGQEEELGDELLDVGSGGER